MIEEFIEATRGPRVQVRVLPQQAAIYQSMFRWVSRRLDSMIGSGEPADRLLVVYSHAGQAETVSMDGERIVVYDQYLGQIMNRLNRLLFESAPVVEVDAYLCKLFALRYLCAGRPREALEYAALYHAWSDRLTNSDPATSAERRKFTLAQECFVLAHEIAHCIFQEEREPARQASSWWVVSTRAEAREADEIAAKIPPDDFPVSYLRDFYAALDRRFGEATAEELAEREARRPEDVLPPDVLDPVAESFLQMLRRVLADPRLAEECACDAVALNVTTQWARGHLRMSATEALSAAVVGLHHLRLLRHIEGLASRGPGRHQEINPLLHETQTRLSLARLSAQTYAWLPAVAPRKVAPPGKSGHAPGLHQALRFENERYAAIISDHLVFELFDQDAGPPIERMRAAGLHDDEPGAPDAWTQVLTLCGLPELTEIRLPGIPAPEERVRQDRARTRRSRRA